MADVAGYVTEADGLVFIGTFERVEPTDQGGSQLVLLQRRYDGETFERSFLGDMYDRETGEAMPLAEDLPLVKKGDRVAVRLKVNVSKRTGNAWYLAYGLEVLRPADGAKTRRQLSATA